MHPKLSPSMTWEGFLGFNTDSFEGLKRCGKFIFMNFQGENIL